MQIEPTQYRQWRQAYRCRSGPATLVIVADIGPRILFLGWHGRPNLLYEDGTGFGVDTWRLYGGHRFTVAPESSETYAADNAPCQIEEREGRLCLSSAPIASGIRRSLHITAAPDGIGFDLRHVLANEGEQAWEGAPWAITCVPHAAIVAPCVASDVRFWPGTNRAQWAPFPDHIPLVPRHSRGKIGCYSKAAWLASLQPEATFVIHSPIVPPAWDCVDGGCNVEIFACPDYVELETLGGRVKLARGGRTAHEQRWRLLAPGHRPEDWAAIATQAGCVSVTPIAHAS